MGECPNCGYSVGEWDEECANCGYRFVEFGQNQDPHRQGVPEHPQNNRRPGGGPHQSRQGRQPQGHQQPPREQRPPQNQPPEPTHPPQQPGYDQQPQRDRDSGIGRRTLLGALAVFGAGAAGWYTLLRDEADHEEPGDNEQPATDESGDSTPGAGSETDDQQINVGVLAGMTGGIAEIGESIYRGTELVREQLGEQTAYTVDLDVADTQVDPGQGVQAAERLREDGYPMFVGAVTPSVNLAVGEAVSVPQEMVQINPADTTDEYSDLDGDWTFRTVPTSTDHARTLARLTAEDLGTESIAVLTADTRTFLEFRQQFIDEFVDRFDGEISAELAYSIGQSSFERELEVLSDVQPDTLLFLSVPQDAIVFFDQYDQVIGARGTNVLVTEQLQNERIPQQVGAELPNVIGLAPSVSGPGGAFFDEFFRDIHGRSPESFHAAHAYDATAALALARVTAGEDDSTMIRDQLRDVLSQGGTGIDPSRLQEGIELAASGEAISYEGVTGPLSFDENGDIEDPQFDIFQFEDDGYSILGSISP